MIFKLLTFLLSFCSIDTCRVDKGGKELLVAVSFGLAASEAVADRRSSFQTKRWEAYARLFKKVYLGPLGCLDPEECQNLGIDESAYETNQVYNSLINC